MSYLHRRLGKWFGCLVLAAGAAAWLGLGTARAEEAKTLTVFAAASLTDVLKAVGAEYEAAAGVKLKFNFASSSALARQVESGAGADLFISANQKWMDYLAEKTLIDPATRQDLLQNRLVLAAPKGKTFAVKLEPGAPVPPELAAGKLAVGETKSVPAGIYALEALTKLGWLETLQPNLVACDSVRSALAFIARGEVAAGIVYETDAKISPDVQVVGVFPADSHAPIVYPAAVLKGSADPAAAQALLKFLASPPAAEVFKKFGFTLP